MYKVIQLGYALFGTGNTISDALNDAKQWLDSPQSIKNIPYYDNAPAIRQNCSHGDMIVVPSEVASELGNYE